MGGHIPGFPSNGPAVQVTAREEWQEVAVCRVRCLPVQRGAWAPMAQQPRIVEIAAMVGSIWSRGALRSRRTGGRVCG